MPSRLRALIAIGFVGSFLTGLPVQAAWIYIGTDECGSGEYYHPDIQRRGSTATLNSFTVLSVPDMAPIWDPKKPTRYKLVKFESEMSTYQFDCKAKTVQLTKRVFYSDGGGLFPIIEHRSTDKLLQEHNSEFAKQFRKTPISFKSNKMLILADYACGKP